MSVDLWETVLVGEEAAVYAYGVLAPRLEGTDAIKAVNARTAHSRARDQAAAELASAGGQATVPGAFEVPFPVDDASSARHLAALVEDRLVNIYCSLAPELSDRQRRQFVESARECCARAVGWGQRPEALPGTDDPTMSPVPDKRRGPGGGSPAPGAGSPGDGASLAP
jgi:hypothetical protein